MLTKTSISALRALVYLAQLPQGTLLPPRRIAEVLGESPTYMAKALRHLVKAGILRAEKGVRGGVRLGRQPESVSLQAVVEACQGAIIGDFCESAFTTGQSCSFHQAAFELHQAITGVLSQWTLAKLLRQPCPTGEPANGAKCVISGGTLSARTPRVLHRLGTGR